MKRGNGILLRAFAASLMLMGSCATAFAQQMIVQRNNVVPVRINATAPIGREALDESVTRIAVQAAFNAAPDLQEPQQKLLGVLLLLSAMPAHGRSAR